MKKDELIRNFIFEIEDTFRDDVPSFIPSEDTIAKFKGHCDAFIRHFPECAEQYNVKEPPEENIAGRQRYWTHKTVAFYAHSLTHPEIREKIYKISELRFFAEIVKCKPGVENR